MIRAVVAIVISSLTCLAYGEPLCNNSCVDDAKVCREIADNRATNETAMMPLGGTTNPAPNANPLEARNTYQTEVQKRRMDQLLQCEMQKTRCMRACAQPDKPAQSSVIFK